MLKLQLETFDMEVNFSCEDAGDHVKVLRLLNELIQELQGHENVNLVVQSVQREEPEHEEEFPVRRIIWLTRFESGLFFA